MDNQFEKLSKEQLAVQYQIATICNESTEIKEVAYHVLKILCDMFGWHEGELWLIDPAINALRNIYTWLDKDTFIELESVNKQTFYHLNEGIPGHIWKISSPYWSTDLSKDVFSTQTSLLLKFNLKSALGFPIVFQKKILGVALFFNDDIPNPDNSLLHMLKSVGEQLGIFVNRIQHKAEQDFLKEELLLKNNELLEQIFFLQQANQAKTTFLANMSHELRTPLNSVIGYTELMYKGKVGPVSPEHKEYLGEIATNSRHLLYLINDILDLTKIESGIMECHPEPTDLFVLVNDVHKAMYLSMLEKKIFFEIYIDPSLPRQIMIDPDKLKQILFNYLSNAIKFTPPEGKISLRVLPDKHNFFRLEVNDTGTGISKTDIDKLFVMFGQLNISYSKPHQGIGLGLALTRHITELLGGQVGVVSEPGNGSTFFAILPLVPIALPVKEPESKGKPRRT